MVGMDPRQDARPAARRDAQPEPVVLDCRGQRCPLPVITLARRLPDVAVGAVLRVLSDDPAAANDIAAWCRMRGQELVATGAVDDVPAYDVRRLT
jgi:tRNA 2-thiouridine synthesizing protein A